MNDIGIREYNIVNGLMALNDAVALGWTFETALNTDPEYVYSFLVSRLSYRQVEPA